MPDTYGDFQCDYTEGIGTLFCVDYDKMKYWLEIKPDSFYDSIDTSYYEELCSKYGKRTWHELNDLKNALMDLGDEAYDNCWYAIARENEGTVESND